MIDELKPFFMLPTTLGLTSILKLGSVENGPRHEPDLLEQTGGRCEALYQAGFREKVKSCRREDDYNRDDSIFACMPVVLYCFPSSVLTISL